MGTNLGSTLAIFRLPERELFYFVLTFTALLFGYKSF